MMTKKDYERAAELVNIHACDFDRVDDVERTIDLFVEFFRGDNPRFDEARFRNACKS